jgi:hypothetical protein
LLLASGQPAKAIEVAACVVSKTTTWNEVKQQTEKILELAWQAASVGEAQKVQERGEGVDLDVMRKQLLEAELFAG